MSEFHPETSQDESWSDKNGVNVTNPNPYPATVMLERTEIPEFKTDSKLISGLQNVKIDEKDVVMDPKLITSGRENLSPRKCIPNMEVSEIHVVR